MPHEFSHVVCRFLCQRRPAHVAHSPVFRTRSRHSPVQDVGIYDSPAYARKNQTGRLHSPALVFGTHLRTTGDSRRRNVIPHSEQAGQEAGAGARRPGVDHDDRTHPGAYRHSDRHDQHISSDRGTRITGGSFRARRGYMGSPDHDGCRITGRPSRACRLSFP